MRDLSPKGLLEGIDIALDDSFLGENDFIINGYGLHSGEIPVKPTNPKNDPTRAITFRFDVDGSVIEVFFDPERMVWNSTVDYNNTKTRLSPDQVGRFLGTDFFTRFSDKLEKVWPMEDPFYTRLLQGIRKREVDVYPQNDKEKVDEDGEFRSGNIDIEKSREKNAAGEQIRTNSGRKIVHFSDFSLTKKNETRYFCWPEKGKEFKYSQWNLSTKIFEDKATPMFIRMSFWHGMYEYGLNLGLRENISDNRGFFSYNLTLQPPVQWCTPLETNDMLTLSNVQHFLRNCRKRIERFIAFSSKEIYDRINNPSHITLDQIEDTIHIIKQNLDILRNPRADTYIYP